MRGRWVPQKSYAEKMNKEDNTKEAGAMAPDFELLIGDRLVLDQRAAGEWCRLQYPGHPHGCPNYGKRATCPPQAPFIGDFFDLKRDLYLIAVGFNLARHTTNMLVKHQGWSLRQARCCLYWQNGVRAELNKKLRDGFAHRADMVATTCPEAMGVNVIETARACGVENITAWPDMPRGNDSPLVYKIAFVGYPSGAGAPVSP